MRVWAAVPEDAAAIARVYNEGIENRSATFETRPRSAEEIRQGWFDGVHPTVVLEEDAGVEAGFRKPVSRVFPENAASRKLLASVGFREVETYEKHARLDGEWRDVVIVERLLPANLAPSGAQPGTPSGVER